MATAVNAHAIIPYRVRIAPRLCEAARSPAAIQPFFGGSACAVPALSPPMDHIGKGVPKSRRRSAAPSTAVLRHCG